MNKDNFPYLKEKGQTHIGIWNSSMLLIPGKFVSEGLISYLLIDMNSNKQKTDIQVWQ